MGTLPMAYTDLYAVIINIPEIYKQYFDNKNNDIESHIVSHAQKVYN